MKANPAAAATQTLDWVVLLGLAPQRFAKYSGLQQYFALARGTDEVQLALDMSKFFDTNYRAPLTSTCNSHVRGVSGLGEDWAAVQLRRRCLSFSP